MKCLILALFTFYTTVTLAAHEMSFDKVYSLPNTGKGEKYFDVSVYISEKSQWQEDKIKERLVEANQVLNTCSVGIRHVYVHKWLPSNQLLRVDDYKSQKKFYDGIRYAGEKSKKVTPIQLFYFEDYLESFTSGPSVPLAVYQNPKIVNEAFDTAWFPYKSAQRSKTSGHLYNEEAHELGHILLRQGHDHTGRANILANNSNSRSLNFSEDQCEALIKTELLQTDPSLNFYPLLSTYFQKYSNRYYMKDWCSRNILNLAKDFELLHGFDDHRVFALYVVHKNKGQSFLPMKARSKGDRWKFHALLVVDGYVLDLDFGKSPRVLRIDDYLTEMFTDKLSDLKFQIRSPLDSPGFTYLELSDSFESPKAKVLDAEGLVDFLK
jgi:hypothetical protein